MPPAAILDVDGTLVDTNYQHAIAWFRAFRQHGEVLPIWRIHRHIGMGGDHLVRALCGDEVEEEKGDEGAALGSIHELFGLTRDTIKRNGRYCINFTRIAVVVLNQKIRPSASAIQTSCGMESARM